MSAMILKNGLRFYLCLLLCAGIMLAGFGVTAGTAHAAREDERTGVMEAGRQAVMYGQIISVRRDSLTIRSGGDKIKVDASELSRSGSLHNFYEDGMFVTVQGTMTDGDEIAARTITRGALRPAVPPYIANDAIIRPEDLR